MSINVTAGRRHVQRGRLCAEQRRRLPASPYSGDAATDTYSASSCRRARQWTSVVVPTGAWTGGGSAISSDFPKPVNNGTSTVVNDGTSGPAQFTYSVPDTATNCCSNGSWQFETVASAAGPVTLPWSYSGTDAFFNVNVGLSAFVTHSGVTTLTPLVADGPSSAAPRPQLRSAIRARRRSTSAPATSTGS